MTRRKVNARAVEGVSDVNYAKRVDFARRMFVVDAPALRRELAASGVVAVVANGDNEVGDMYDAWVGTGELEARVQRAALRARDDPRLLIFLDESGVNERARAGASVGAR